MQNTQSLFPLYDIPLHHLCFSVHPDCVFCIVPSIWYTFASLVFFCPPGLCVLHCSLSMLYLCITCVFLSTQNTSDAKVYHVEETMQNTQTGWTEKHKWCKGISYRENNAKHTIQVDRKHCFLYMIYLCITCVFLSTQIVCFALFPLYDIPLHHFCSSVHFKSI
jgi:DNA-directed RNA polymerase subunit RPC12/RpoP